MYGHLKMQHRTVLQQRPPAIGISHTLAPYELLAEGHVDSAGIVTDPTVIVVATIQQTLDKEEEEIISIIREYSRLL